MANEEKRLKDALEQLDQDTQYGLRRPNPDYRPPMYEKTPDVKNAWGSEQIQEDPHRHKIHTGAKYFFFGALALCVLAIGIALLKAQGVFGPKQNAAIEMTIDAPPFVDGGTATPVVIHVTNKSTVPLELADIVLTYQQPQKEGIATGSGFANATLRMTAGDIGIGNTNTQTFSIKLFGSEGDSIPLIATLEYRTPNSNAIFTKEIKTNVQIRSTPLTVGINAPNTIVAGQTVSYTISATNKSANMLTDLIVDVAYPPGFTYVASNPTPFQGTHLWDIQKLEPGEVATITVQGIITAQPLESKVVRASVGTHELQTNKIAILLNTGMKTVTVVQPVLSGSVDLAGRTGTVPVQANVRTDGTVTIVNTLAYAISNVSAVLTFSGGLYDAAGIDPRSGYFNSNNQTITWQGGELDSIESGATKTLNFRVTPKAPADGANVSTNKLIKASLTLSAVVPGGVVTTLNDVTSVTGVLATTVSFDAKTQYGSPLQGAVGPVPPKVGQKTKYTVMIDVSNTVNQVINGTLQTTLPSYVTWEGTNTSGLTYNDVTRTVTWAIPSISSGSGYSQNTVKGNFAVSITPSSTQIGDQPYLTDAIEFMGTDSVAKVEVRHKRTYGVKTTLTNDPVYGSGQGTIIP